VLVARRQATALSSIMKNSLVQIPVQACLLILSSTLLHAAAPASPQGVITGKAFLGIPGTGLGSLTGNTNFPGQPDVVMYPAYFEWNATGDILTPAPDWADNYGTQLIGYFYPPSTGTYIFYLAADDNAELYLSTDGTAENKRLIAEETEWSDPREFLSSGGGSDLASKDSSQFAGTQWPTTDPATGLAMITLQANQPYYIEALAKEGTGGDNVAVAVLDPNFIIDSSLPIPGDYLSSDRATGPLMITVQPQNQTTVERGAATFRVTVDGTPPHTFQWRKNGEDIPDATNVAYRVTSAPFSDNNAAFSVVVTGPEGFVTSADATLTVTPDTVPPTLLSAKGLPTLTEVTLVFSEPMDPTTAGNPANYQINTTAGTVAVSGAAVSPDGAAVTLTTASQTLGTRHTVTVNGVVDTAATPNPIAADSTAVFFPTGQLREDNGFIVFEAENYDRNLDGLWVPDSTRGTPSGGLSMVNPNGAGGNENATKLEYDIEFDQAGSYVVWYRASGDNGEDDSGWFHIDGARPIERTDANQASMTGFQPQADFVWRSDSQDGPDPFTVEIGSPGLHTVALARREDGSYFDKFILTTDTAFTPTGFGPPETREGAPDVPTVTLTAPTDGQSFPAGSAVTFTANASGGSGLEIVRVEFTANGTEVGEATSAPFSFTWPSVPAGIYSLRAVAIDEIGVSAFSDPIIIEVGGDPASARIAWVSFHPADDMPSTDASNAGFTNAADVAYTQLLRQNGHDVTRVVTSGTPDTELLNAFDLVIISRSVGSGDYQEAAETAAWNGITAPTLILGGYVLRANRLGFVIGNGIPDTIGPVRLTVNDPDHPIFEGIDLDDANTMANPYADVVMFNGVVQRGISVNADPVAGAGTVLATIGTPEDPAFGGTVIAEWEAGDTLANATGDTLGGQRVVLLTGSRENDGLTSQGAGIYDLNPDGAQIFLNAVNYLAGTEPPVDRPTLSVSRTQTGLSITFTDGLQSADSVTGPWTAVAGATSPYAVTPDQAQRFYRAVR
jgi:hypothetical protein